MKIAFCTLGCKVNQYETDLLKQKFEENGYSIVDFNENADIYLINSCSVTNMSDRKSRQMINHTKKVNPNSIAVVTGCYAQAIKERISEYPNIDIAIGNAEKEKAVEIVENYIKEKADKCINVSDINVQRQYIQEGMLHKAYDVRESVKVEDGCNNFCSYCIIPYVRGRVRSRAIEDVRKEVEGLVENGVKEVIVVGIEIASYGLDLENDINLIDVIEEINKVEGLERIRLGSLEPRWITSENVERMKNVEKLCPHFHLSLQSGSTSVLKRMNRKYTAEEFKEVVKRLKNAFENVALTTDLIVGFPGETEEEFNETLDLVKEVEFKEIHVFKYSKRSGTRAASMQNQVPGEIMNERSRKLINLSNELEEKYNEKYINKEVEFLIERVTEDYVEGYTKRYIKIKMKRMYENWERQGIVKTIKLEKEIIQKEI